MRLADPSLAGTVFLLSKASFTTLTVVNGRCLTNPAAFALTRSKGLVISVPETHLADVDALAVFGATLADGTLEACHYTDFI